MRHEILTLVGKNCITLADGQKLSRLPAINRRGFGLTRSPGYPEPLIQRFLPLFKAIWHCWLAFTQFCSAGGMTPPGLELVLTLAVLYSLQACVKNGSVLSQSLRA